MEGKVTKTCYKCGHEKPLDEFHRNRRKKDGRQGECRECSRAYKTAHMKAQRGYNRIYRAENVEERREGSRIYRAENAGRVKGYRTNYRHNNSEKIAAHATVRREDIVRRPCEICGAKKTEAHHEDYSRQLNVNWLCHKHHSQLHRGKDGLSKEVRDKIKKFD